MTGVISEFLQALLSLPERSESFGYWRKGYYDRPRSSSSILKLLTRYEQLINGGTVTFEQQSKEDIPALSYHTVEGYELPLNLASSTVQETAPIFLLLKNQLQAGSWIVIEEPEAHLSPDNQRAMAAFLVALVRARFKVVITTHSTYLLEQINNFIAASAAKRAGVQSIDSSMVAAHKASLLTNPKRSLIMPLEVDPVDGIDLDDFTRVYTELYEQGYELKEDASKD